MCLTRVTFRLAKDSHFDDCRLEDGDGGASPSYYSWDDPNFYCCHSEHKLQLNEDTVTKLQGPTY